MSRDLVLITISLFTWGAGEGMFIYFQPLYLQKWGADPLQIGAILSAAGLAMAVSLSPAGYLADQIGSRPVMWIAWVMGCIATGIMALAGSLPVFTAGLILYGLTGFVSAPMNSYITSVRGKLSVERALSYVMAVYSFGAVLGPAVGGWVGETFGLGAVYRIAALIFLVSTLVVFTLRRAPQGVTAQPVKANSPHLLRNPRFAGLLALISLTMFTLYLPQPLTSVFLQGERGLSLAAIGQLGSIGSLGNAILMLALGHLSAPLGLFTGQALVGLFALLIWRGDQFSLYALGYFALGGYRLSRSMALAYARRLVNAHEVGLAYGLIETGNALGAILAPTAAGLLYFHAPETVFTASLAGIGIMLAVNLLYFGRRQRGASTQTIVPGDTRG